MERKYHTAIQTSGTISSNLYMSITVVALSFSQAMAVLPRESQSEAHQYLFTIGRGSHYTLFSMMTIFRLLESFSLERCLRIWSP